MAIMGWDLLLIPIVMATAALLMAAGLVGLRTHRAGLDRAPEGTVVALMVVAILVGIATLVVLVVIKADLIVADLRATMASETVTRTHLETPEAITTPRTIREGGLIRLTEEMLGATPGTLLGGTSD
jgi:hypothetical protein